jgi:dTDP-4-amino-4,6-dideoxygalactose transaminase
MFANLPQAPVPFSRPEFIGNESIYVAHALANGMLASGDVFSSRCERWLAQECGCEHVHLVQSATVGLELAVLTAGLGPGDEVILPSFTFVSCANAIALRGATPVFAEIDPDTLTLDPTAAEAAVSERTRAIMAVHYAGVPCDMDAIRKLANRHRLLLIEDAAQALLSRYRGRPAGSLGDIGVFSFHHTKNVTCGEGGAIVINAATLTERTKILHQKGTNRASFDRGAIRNYTWLDLGSSFAPSEITAAVLLAQLERANEITESRRAIWSTYHAAFAALEAGGRVRRPVVPDDVVHNGHLFYLLLEDRSARDAFIQRTRECGIATPFHYVPLHNSPGGLRYARSPLSLAITESVASRLVRLPLWPGMAKQQDRIIDAVMAALR